jgi:uncharacterized protein YjbI with pentapeptide repeats
MGWFERRSSSGWFGLRGAFAVAVAAGLGVALVGGLGVAAGATVRGTPRAATVSLSDALEAGAGTLRPVSFNAATPFINVQRDDLVIDGCIIRRRARCPRAQLEGADLRRADLSEARLRFAKLGNANLSSAYLSEAKLTGASLPGARLQHANLRRADLHGARLHLANLTGANLTGANLSNVYFCQTIMPNGSKNNSGC